jgi:hypothetical protein
LGVQQAKETDLLEAAVWPALVIFSQFTGLGVHFYSVLLSSFESFFYTLQCVFTIGSGSEPVVVFSEAIFKDWLNDLFVARIQEFNT